MTYYKECLSIQEASLPAHHPDIVRTTTSLEQTTRQITRAVGQSGCILSNLCGCICLQAKKVDVQDCWHGHCSVWLWSSLSLFQYFSMSCGKCMTRVSHYSSHSTLDHQLFFSVASNTTCGTDWIREGVVVAGNDEYGSALSQLHQPQWSLC